MEQLYAGKLDNHRLYFYLPFSSNALYFKLRALSFVSVVLLVIFINKFFLHNGDIIKLFIPLDANFLQMLFCLLVKVSHF